MAVVLAGTMFVTVRVLAHSHWSANTAQVFLLPGWLLLLGFTVCAAWSSDKGITDRHVWDMELEKYEKDALVLTSRPPWDRT